MGLIKHSDRSNRADNAWTADLQDTGKAPIVVGLIIAGLLVVGIATWQLLFGINESFFFKGKSQEESQSNEKENAVVSAGIIYVHVVGCVNMPGVYALDPNARVYDAIAAAGGLREEASAEALNMARLVADGEQIRVPSSDEMQAETAEDGMSSQQANNMVVNGKVNINTADSETLQTLSGVGASTAEKIIADREANGPFATIEDLKRVSGIGDKKFAALSDSICVG